MKKVKEEVVSPKKPEVVKEQISPKEKKQASPKDKKQTPKKGTLEGMFANMAKRYINS